MSTVNLLRTDFTHSVTCRKRSKVKFTVNLLPAVLGAEP